MTVTKKKSRRGAERHAQNPFIAQHAVQTRNKVKRTKTPTGEKMMVVSEKTGEVIAPAGGFWFVEEIDNAKFVKLYVNGVKAFKELSNAGTKVFEIMYIQVQNAINRDEIILHFNAIDQNATPISESTFFRGMKELVAKGFLAESTVPTRYFINPDYMWNGDRLAFVKEYVRKNPPVLTPAVQALEDTTGDLFEHDQLEDA